MEIVPLRERYFNNWNEFCLRSRDTWFWHTSDWIDYTIGYKPLLQSKNLSFFVMKDNQIFCICPILLEKNNDKSCLEFSFGGGYLPSPSFAPSLSNKQEKKLKNFIFNYIDELAVENGVKRLKFTISALSLNSLDFQQWNYFLHHGFLDTSIQTIVLNLKRDIKQIWSDVRHGARSSINSIKKKGTSRIYTNKTITDEIFSNYQKMHLKAAGRITRPQITFDMMKKWISQNKAILVSAEMNGVEIGYSYFIIYKKNAYYASGANDPDKIKLPISHVILWDTIEWLNEKSFSFLEIGPYSYPSLNHLPSTKEMAIGVFKRGFGGQILPNFYAEKYYSKEFCQEQILSRVNRYLQYKDG